MFKKIQKDSAQHLHFFVAKELHLSFFCLSKKNIVP